jgi:carbon monoxide dehydrogenase subunit G
MAMELDNSFTVPVPPDQAWDVLLDVQRIAPCMPGATVDEVEGDVVNGRIKVKVGPVSLTYRGTAKFTERDPDARLVVVEASGKETRGAGTAAATVRASLAPDASGDGTQVTMHTTMNVTGRPAQFGRGVMVEVGGKLVDQFAANLARLITGDSGAEDSGGHASGGAAAVGASVDGASAPTATADGPSGNRSGAAASPVASTAAGPVASTPAGPVASTTTGPAASATAPAQEDSLNLLKVAGPVILKRLVPVLVGAIGLALLSRLFWRRRRGPGQAEQA